MSLTYTPFSELLSPELTQLLNPELSVRVYVRRVCLYGPWVCVYDLAVSVYDLGL